MSRLRPFLVALATGAAVLGGTWGAVAQVPVLDGNGSPPSTTTTSPAPPPPSDTAGGGGGDAPAPAPSAGANQVPPEYQQLIAGVRRTPANNTRALLADLAQLEQFGLSAQDAAIVGMGRFPVAGYASFVDDWWFPRFVPTFHLHQGTDIFAAYGTPVRAPVDGRFRHTNGKVGGLAAYVTMPDGTYFYMAHLSGLAPGLVDGQEVKTGDVVGYVGDSGNARGGAPHVHFEIHPRGGPPINPKPYLDRFVAEARARVPLLVEHYRRLAASAPAGPVAAPAAAPVPAPSPAPALAAAPPAPAGPLLWVASMSPATGSLRLAEAEVAAAAAGIDWAAVQARDAAAAEVRAQVRALLDPITPRALAAFFS